MAIPAVINDYVIHLTCIMPIPGKSYYSRYFDNIQNSHTNILMIFNCASTETVAYSANVQMHPV